MYLSLNWIKEFVNLDGIPEDEIANRLTMSVAEVEDVVKKGVGFEDIVVAKIVETHKLENSNHLNIMKVDDGSGSLLQIVTGAPNVYQGMKTFLVRVGGMVAGHKIKIAKLAGHESFGMCCSEAELGIGSDDEGIVDFLGDEPLGSDIRTFLPIEDTIIEIENKSLSNRPDLWGHYGFARELACIFNRSLMPLETADLSVFSKLPKIDINIETDKCLRYSALAVSNILKKTSPYAMKIRLGYCGLRDINLLADITNYVMLEVGQPMHAFDFDIVKSINVLQASGCEKMLTLEGEEHILPKNSIVIADQNKSPVAIAGIKGGKLSSIGEKTSSLLLESATFDASTIRKTSKTISLFTDSSMRYEKTLDPELTKISVARLLYILRKICPEMKVVSSFSDVYKFRYPVRKIAITNEFICNRGGAEVSENFVINTLQKLGFVVEKHGKEIDVTVPSFRATKDISIKEDLVEEIFRIFGYDNIQPKTIKSDVKSVEIEKKNKLEYKVKRLLAEKYGASEVHSYIWNFGDFNKFNGIETKSFVSLMDSSNSGQSGIRSEMAPTMLKFFDENKNFFDEIIIDEIGSVVVGIGEDKNVIERRNLCVLLASAKKTQREVYFDAKKIVQNIADSLMSTKIEFDENIKRPSYIHPINSVGVKTALGEIGYFGLLHPTILKKIDRRFSVAIIELDFNKFCDSPTFSSEFSPPSKFQGVFMDFNFIVPNSMKYSKIESLFGEFRSKFSLTYKLIDIYENIELFGDAKSMTFSLEIGASDHTLSTNEIETFRMRFLDHMKRAGVVLR